MKQLMRKWLALRWQLKLLSILASPVLLYAWALGEFVDGMDELWDGLL